MLFTSSGILRTAKIFINVIRRLPAFEVLNFQSSGFLKALLQFTESPNIFEYHQEMFGADTRA